jgi:hypothetical protein
MPSSIGFGCNDATRVLEAPECWQCFKVSPLRLKFRSSQVTTHLTGRDRRNDFEFDGFIGQLAVNPFGNGTPRQFRWLTGDRHDERHLFGSKLSERSTSGSITQNIFDRSPKFGVRFTAFDGNQ